MRHSPRRVASVAAVAAAVALATGCASALPLDAGLIPPAPPPATVAAATVPRAAPTTPATALRPSTPVGLVVPAIGVRTGALRELGLDPGGALEVPPDATTAGWFTLGPTPGSTGPAVIAAHVELGGVPGLFARLRDLGPGAEVRVARADGSEAVFTTYRVDRYDKSAFPTERVYGDTPLPELRLITCGGAFDDSTGQYRDNVVAYARLTG